ncbi:MAG: hypothetical protein H6Q90_1568 [Deltaproteobacteria bacterium]|nr:hypothetical protein [Deltaproteobacteria bacterium]
MGGVSYTVACCFRASQDTVQLPAGVYTADTSEETMTRALSSLCLLLTLVLGGSSAFAKDKIAILGLEVVNNTIDADSTKVASELTVGLRLRPKAGQGPFAFAPGSEKELIDEKLMNSCETEKEDCMTPIGKNLGATYLLYGKIEKKSLGSQVGYQISLKLLKIPVGPGAGQIANRWTEFIPIAEAQGPKLQDWARRGYKGVTNDSSDGKLVVKANVDRGTILLDGKESGNIVNKRGEVPNLTDGRYTLAVEAQGYKRWEADQQVTIRGGETTTADANLVEMKPGTVKFCDPAVSTCENTTTDAPKTGLWKGMMFTGIALAAGGGGLWVFSFTKINDANDKLCGSLPYPCKNSDPSLSPSQRTKLEDQGNKYSTLSYVGGGAVAVGVIIGSIGVWKGYVAAGSREKQAAGSQTVGRSVRKRRSFAVTPVVSAQGAGATLRFDW